MNTVAIAETYMDVHRLLWQLVHKFHNQYGGELEELFSSANVAYMKAYRSYERSKGAFSTWLHRIVWYSLLEDARQIARRRRKVQWEHPKMDAITVNDARGRMVDFLDALSEDARLVVKLVVDTPIDLRLALKEERVQVKSALREFLQDLGWTAERVAESFSEIRGAL